MAESDVRFSGARMRARKRALDILFEADLRDGDPLVSLADHVGRGEPPVRPFTSALVQGVAAERGRIDDLIAASLTGGWTLARMPRVDRALAEIATFELLHGDVAPQVAISQAVSLGAALSTDDSPGFLNAVLDRVLRTLTERGELSPDASRSPERTPEEGTVVPADDSEDADGSEPGPAELA